MHFVEKKAGQKRVDFDKKLKSKKILRIPGAYNPLTAKLMSEHVDCDVSKILSREMNLDQAGDKLIETTLKVANGRLTCAEALGHREFVMTKLYRSA